LDPGGRSLDVRPVDVARIQPDPGVVRHDIGSLTALLEDVVDARGRLEMLTYQIDTVSAEFSRVHRAASEPGTSSGVRCFSKEFDPHTVRGRGPEMRNGCIRVGM